MQFLVIFWFDELKLNILRGKKHWLGDSRNQGSAVMTWNSCPWISTRHVMDPTRILRRPTISENSAATDLSLSLSKN